MLTINSSIPTTVREGFSLQDLPQRVSTLNEEILENIFGGQTSPGCQVQSTTPPGGTPTFSCVKTSTACGRRCVLYVSGTVRSCRCQ